MKAGLIENWSDVEDIWEYMLYDELGMEEGNHPILITEVANTPKKNREKIAEVRPVLWYYFALSSVGNSDGVGLGGGGIQSQNFLKECLKV